MKSRKRLFSLVLILSAILIIGNGQPLGATDWSVCPSGCDYTTIAAALADTTNVVAGDTVVVGTPDRTAAETYAGGFTMRDQVDVVSEPKDDTTTANYTDPWSVRSGTATVLERTTLTIISKDGAAETGPVVEFDEADGGDYVLTGTTKLEGFIIEYDPDPSDDYPIIGIRGGGSYAEVTNCIIRDNLSSTVVAGGIGTRGDGTYDTAPTISNNLIHHAIGPGIGNRSYSHATITENEIWDMQSLSPGIGLQEDTYPTIENNKIFECRTGIGSHANGLEAKGGTLTIPPIKGNEIYQNGAAGIELVRNPSDTTGTINATIGASGTGKNYIHDNDYPGITLEDITNFTIDNNDIENNGGTNQAGISIEGNFTQGIIKHNTVWDSATAGLNNSGGTGRVVVVDNTFTTNTNAGMRLRSDGITDIIGNKIHTNSRAGIRIDKGTGTITQNNIYSNVYAGIVFYGVAADTCDFDFIKNNIYSNGSTMGAGMALYLTATAKPELTIRQNRVYDQIGPYGYNAGIQLQCRPGASSDKRMNIENNLVFGNQKAGIRIGSSVWDSQNPIRNNTVVGNGSGAATAKGNGGGIIYAGDSLYAYYVPEGTAPDSFVLKNNILTHNKQAGMRVGAGDPGDPCPTLGDPDNLDYNLLYANFEWNHVYGIANDPDCSWEWDPPCIKMIPCAQQQYGGCYGYKGGSGCPNGVQLYHDNDIMEDPKFVNGPDDAGDDDYHLQSDSPALGAGDDSTQMGCYGGAYPINNLIDVDEGTGNTNSDGTYVTFDLGATASFAITDVRLYTSAVSMNWDVYVGSSPASLTKVKDDWAMSSAGWHETTVTQQSGTRYIKLESNGVSVPTASIFEFSYKKNEDATFYWDGSQFWRTPSIVADSTYTNIDG